jgi:hypothetical protein
MADEIVLAQICHIIAASDDGPRGDPCMSLKARNEHENLLLMCPTHHVIVDTQHAAYPAPLLREWKALSQRETIAGLAAYRAAIARYLAGELTEGALFRRNAEAAPIEPRLQAMGRDAVVAHNLEETMARLDEPLAAVIGGSGSGKTTLLHQMALAASEARVPSEASNRGGALPLVINCSRFAGSLPALIASEARNLTGIEIDLDGVQGLDFPLNLYCDDFQYCPDKKTLLEQLRAFNHQHKGARCTLFTHELTHYRALERFNVAAYRIADLDDDGMLDLFKGFIDEEAAEALLDDLAGRGEAEAIRQPVLAALVATAHRDIRSDGGTRSTPLRRGELLRRVISDGLLTQWVAVRSPDLSSPHAQQTRQFLAEVAAKLVEADKESLPQDELIASKSDAPDRSVAIGIASGLLRRHEEELGFAHAVIRDYFAAEWMLEAPPRQVVSAWFATRWHAALRNFASLWVPDPQRLFWLRVSGWASLRLITVLRVFPNGFATRLFYLMLEFAAESRLDEPWLQLGIFRRYRFRSTFLDEKSADPHPVIIGGWEDKVAHVYRLFGRLHHPVIDRWLRTEGRRRYTIHGIRQDTSEAGLEALLRGLGSDGDGIANDVSIELAFEYPKAMLRCVFDRLLADPSVHHARMLRMVAKARHVRKDYPRGPQLRRASGRDRIGRVLSGDSYWRDRMLGLLLDAEEDALAGSAADVLRCFEDSGWLRDDVERPLVQALRSGKVLARRRAAMYLVYGQSDDSLATLVETVRGDADRTASVTACDSLLYRDVYHAPEYYLALLRRWGNLDGARWQTEQAAISRKVAEWATEKNNKRYKKYVRNFLAYLECGGGAFERIVASHGINRILGRVIADALHAALEKETDDVTRNQIAELWATRHEITTDEAIRYLLSSPSRALRSLAAEMVRRRQDDPSDEMVEFIRQSAASDEDSQVRYDLGCALDYLEVRNRIRARPFEDDDEDRTRPEGSTMEESLPDEHGASLPMPARTKRGEDGHASSAR